MMNSKVQTTIMFLLWIIVSILLRANRELMGETFYWLYSIVSVFSFLMATIALEKEKSK